MMKNALYMALACCFSLSMVSAQQTYVWEHYKVQITVPDDFKVVTNTDEEFEMKGDGMDLFMAIFEENVSIDDLNKATLNGAMSMQLGELDEATPVTANGLEGYYVEGFKEGHRVMFAGLGDPKSHTNFFLVITFLDDDPEANKAAIDILGSLDVL